MPNINETPLIRPEYMEKLNKKVEDVICRPYFPKLNCCCCNAVITYKLKPCPWCGETTDLSFRHKPDDHTVVQCGTCHRIVKAMDAVEAWNSLLRKE